MASEISLVVGDVLKIERRYLVDGVLATTTEQGRFAGVSAIGTAEHIVIRDATTKEARLFPLHTVAQITVVKHARRPRVKKSAPQPAAWDPGVA